MAEQIIAGPGITAGVISQIYNQSFSIAQVTLMATLSVKIRLHLRDNGSDLGYIRRMKIISHFIIVCTCLLQVLAFSPAMACSLTAELSLLEQNAFGKTDSDGSIESRLSALEIKAFGSTKRGNARR